MKKEWKSKWRKKIDLKERKDKRECKKEKTIWNKEKNESECKESKTTK